MSMTTAEYLRRKGIEYLFKLPAAVPGDKVLVHNQVVVGITPTRRLGYRGFRAWLSSPDPRLYVCRCGWRPELGQHFRVRFP
jgi:hypothetical protein